jgi:large subunit ribosomal protein L24e
MPRTRECDFCGDDIEPGTGTMFVQNDGSTVMFCSSKCEKNADLGREARDMGWTEAGRSAGGKRAAETADDPEPEAEEEPEDETATDADAVEDTGAAPDLEDAESDAVTDSEDDGAEEAAADVDEAAEAEEADGEDAEEEDADEAEEEEAEA